MKKGESTYKKEPYYEAILDDEFLGDLNIPSQKRVKYEKSQRKIDEERSMNSIIISHLGAKEKEDAYLDDINESDLEFSSDKVFPF